MSKRLRIILYTVSILFVVLIVLVIAKNVLEESGSRQTANSTLSEEFDDADDAAEQGGLSQGESFEADGLADAADSMKNETMDAGSSAVSDVFLSEDGHDRDSLSDTVLFFGGDVLLGNAVCSKYNSGGLSAILSDDLIQAGRDADIMMVNEEFPFSTRGAAIEDKQYTFRTDPSYISIFGELGVDIVSLANNHILDYGTDPLLDSITTLDAAGIAHVGAGATIADAKELSVIEKNGTNFGFLSASRVWPDTSWSASSTKPGVFGTYDASALLTEIETAKEQCDYLVVYVHWGIEYQEYPQDYQRTLAKSYIEAGADAVIGAHSHCLQGIEFFDGKPVFYSLGNYIFGMNTDKAACVEIVCGSDGSVSYRLLPAKSYGAYTYGVDGDEAQSIYDYMEGISYDIAIDADGWITHR